ncbi:5-oxoprolinase subunit PxpB [Bacillus sp. V3B]|uniref:5-oxoprolinase subunit PxpB n=1 Tax=Bacillus sp. V3B TaxID=2804915 RepID=UPI00210CE0D0|nr:5-oxoprolinase subunit PxpB [Bacillus sp. V3B]MCQ6274230.1 5-oxoprolinase subunit PxpB [Bacillus sp. V3B]
MNYQLFPVGEHAILIELGEELNMDTHQKVQYITSYLDDHPFEWMVEYIPAFTTITIFFDPIKIARLNNKEISPYDFVYKQVEEILSSIKTGKKLESRRIEIPVCYGGKLGPDLETVARINKLSPEEVIQIHTSGEYLVFMIGFAPGFPYMGGMSEKIATPRRESPRLASPERSVGIAGNQTGVYPIETPGGWQLIGRTPLKLFLPEENPPTLLRAGDQIKFRSISYKEYIEWGAIETNDHNH